MLEALDSAQVGDRGARPNHTPVFQYGTHVRFVGDKGCGVVKPYSVREIGHLHASHEKSKHAVGLGNDRVHMISKCELGV